MSAFFLPSFVSTATASLAAAGELLTLVAQLLALVVGIRLISDVLDILTKAIAALRWLAGLVQLVLMLVCSVLGDVAPIIGRHAGRAAGTAYRLGRQARRLYDTHLQPTVNALVLHLDQTGRAFVLEQLGTAYPAVTSAARYQCSVDGTLAGRTSAEPAQCDVEPSSSMTRRQLLQLAKAQGLPRYSRMTTAQLREAIAA